MAVKGAPSFESIGTATLPGAPSFESIGIETRQRRVGRPSEEFHGVGQDPAVDTAPLGEALGEFGRGVIEDPIRKMGPVGTAAMAAEDQKVLRAVQLLDDPNTDWERVAEQQRQSLDWEANQPQLAPPPRAEYLARRKAITAKSARESLKGGVEGYFKYLEEQEKKEGIAVTAGRITSQMPSWMLDFYMTGGAAKALSVPAKRFLRKKVGSALLARVGSWGVSAGTRATVSPHRLFAATVERELKRDEEPLTALANAWVSTAIEYGSEELGQTILRGGLSKAAARKLRRQIRTGPATAKFIKSVEDAWKTLKPENTTSKFAQRMLTKGGFHGMLGEIGEERIATLMHGAVGTEDYGLGPEASPIDRMVEGIRQDLVPERMGAEAISFGLVGAGQVGAAQIGQLQRESAIAEQRQRYQEATAPYRRAIGGLYERPQAGEMSPEAAAAAMEGMQKQTGEFGAPLIMPTEAEPIQQRPIEAARTQATEELERRKAEVAAAPAADPLIAQKYTQMEQLIEQFQAEQDPARRDDMVAEMEQIDADIQLLSDLGGKDIKELHRIARRLGVTVPKGAGRTAILRLLGGTADLSQIQKTDTGYRVEVPLAETEAGRGWTVREFDNFAEAVDFLSEPRPPEEGGAPAKITKPVPEPQEPEQIAPPPAQEPERVRGAVAEPAEAAPEAVEKPPEAKPPTEPAEREPAEKITESKIKDKGQWKLTLDEYIAKYGKKGQEPGIQKAFFDLNHRKWIQWALANNKPVPRQVLEEYKSEKWAQEALAKPIEIETPQTIVDKAQKIANKTDKRVGIYQDKEGKWHTFTTLNPPKGVTGYEAITPEIAEAQPPAKQPTEKQKKREALPKGWKIQKVGTKYDIYRPDGKLWGTRATRIAAIKYAQTAAAKEPEIGKDITSEQAKEPTIVEPAPSPEVQQRAADEAELQPTGTLDPSKEKDALKIIEQHRKYLNQEMPYAFDGIYKLKWDTDKRERVVDQIIYSRDQVDQAYRTVQKSVESPMADTKLFAMPGKEKQMEALGQKMARQKPRRPAGRKAPSIGKPKPLPKPKVNKSDHIKAVYEAGATEEGRYAIEGMYVKGDELVATDGHRLFIAKGKWGKDGLYLNPAAHIKGELGKLDKSGKKFPSYKDILPRYEDKDIILIDDLESLWNRINQAAAMTTEESKGIAVILNKDGTLGFAVQSPEVGHAEINVQPGGKILGGANPDFLLDAISFHAVRGDKHIRFYFPQPDRPIYTRSTGGKTQTVTMPINYAEPSEGLKKAIEPPKKAEVRKKGFRPDPSQEGEAKGEAGFAGVPGRPGGKVKKPWLTAEKVDSPDPEIREFFQRTKRFGSKKASDLLDKVKIGLRERFITTPHIPRTKETAFARDTIRTMPEAIRAAKEEAYEEYARVLDGDGSTEVLSTIGLQLYAYKIFVEDFIVEAEAGRKVPGGFSLEQLQSEKRRIDKLVTKVPSVERAYKARQELWRKVSADLAERGVISEENARNPHYVRHFVLHYMENRPYSAIGAKRKKLKEPFRAYKIGRKGTELDVSTDILEVDTHALAEIYADNAVEDAANEIGGKYNEPKQEGKEGFVEWHYKRPNVFYRATTADAAKIAQMVEDAVDEVDIVVPKAMLRDALVMGAKRKGWIIPKWLAAQLDDLPVNKRSGYVVDSFSKPFTKLWKRFILRVNLIRYNLRNLIGDSERLHASGRTHAFLRSFEAVKILFKKEGELFDMARRHGVVGTSLWHEMGMAHRQKIFDRFEKVKNMTGLRRATMPLKYVLRTVSSVGNIMQDMTQFREDILRMGVFLDALDDVDNFRAGKKTRYGKHIRHWAGTQADVEAVAKENRWRAAAKISRETLLDYGDFTPWENDVLRQGLVPFYSFMKKNAQFWPHAMKEAAKEGGRGKGVAVAGTKAGWSLGKWAVRILFLYALAFLWNRRDDEAAAKDDALAPWLRSRPHLNVGDGTLWGQTALSDLTEWFNLDDIAGDLERFDAGYITFDDLMKAVAVSTAKGPVNKLYQGLNPFLKAPVTALGYKTFPDVLKPRQFAKAWSGKAVKEAVLEPLGTDVKRFMQAHDGKITVKEALSYYFVGSMYRDTSPEELERQIKQGLKYTALKGRSPTTRRRRGQAKKGEESEHEILRARQKALKKSRGE